MPQIILDVSEETLEAIKSQVEASTNATVHDPLALLKAMLEEDEGLNFELYIDNVLHDAKCSDGFQAQYEGLGEAVVTFEDEDAN